MKRKVTQFWWLPFVFLTVVAGCSSTHNFRTDGHSPFGGGFADNEITKGLYQLTATANRAPWPTFGAAIDTWRGRAEQLCGGNRYQQIVTSQDAGFQGTAPVYLRPGLMPEVPKYNTTISGYILCDTSGMTRDQAVKYLDDLAAANARELVSSRKKELEELGGSNCSASDSFASAENYFRRGKTLSALNDYKPALTCFMKAQENEQDTTVYREACIAIGTMYELGWGVEKDLPTAMTWFKKGGL
ncbi:MAG: sel1 repeat family protein [Rhodocyclales bacterium]|nr:sel1 repeat family protein [Rhodocyclales bacterium]